MTFSTGWWSTFFSGPANEATKIYASIAATRAETEFIAKALELAPGSAVLDVPCGNGRIALELAALGHRARGVDQAPDLIDDARRSAAGRGLGAEFEVRDMRDLPWKNELDGAFCFGNSFAYMDDEANLEFLRAVHRSLRPGARFVLETGVVAESLLPHLQTNAWYQGGGMYLLADRRHDPAEARLHVSYTFVIDGKVETRPASYRIYMFRELSGLLRSAGFEVLSAAGSLEGEPYALGSRDLILTMRKEG